MGITSESADNFALSHVTLMTPNRQRILFRDLTIDPGKRVNLLVVGQSGVGKSSLLRAIAGLWNQGQGIVKRRLKSMQRRPTLIAAFWKQAALPI